MSNLKIRFKGTSIIERETYYELGNATGVCFPKDIIDMANLPDRTLTFSPRARIDFVPVARTSGHTVLRDTENSCPITGLWVPNRLIAQIEEDGMTIPIGEEKPPVPPF